VERDPHAELERTSRLGQIDRVYVVGDEPALAYRYQAERLGGDEDGWR
jgi:hypothetical protein